MSSLPPALNFAETEEVIVKKWKDENSFHLQNELSIERGDEVSLVSANAYIVSAALFLTLFAPSIFTFPGIYFL